jgi:uncharacterized membrane protein HdeD (DUF308 family)
MDVVGGGEARAVLARLGQAWGWIVAYGVASVLAGLIAVLWPGATLVVIAIIFAAQLLVAAIYQFVFAFAVPKESGWLRALFALLAIVSFAVALFLFGHVGLTLLILGILLGVYWIAQGAIELFLAIEHPELRARAWIVVSGILSVVAGGVVVLFPTTSLFFLTIILGFWLVIFGAVLIVRGWLLRGLAHQTKAVAQPS